MLVDGDQQGTVVLRPEDTTEMVWVLSEDTTEMVWVLWDSGTWSLTQERKLLLMSMSVEQLEKLAANRKLPEGFSADTDW